MKRKSFSLLISILAVVLVAGACKPKSNSVKIALAIPLTGDIASLGLGIQRAVTMAVEDANNSGALPFKVELVSFDDRSDPKEAVSVANRIVSDKSIMGVIGHFNSGCSIPASSIYAQAHLPMLTPASSNPLLTEQQLSPQWTWPKCIFRVNSTDKVQGPYGADFIFKDLKLTRVAVIHDKTSYGQGVAEEFKKHFEKIGGTIVAFEGLQVGDRDFRSLLTRVKSTNPQAIYFGGIFAEGGILVRQARDIQFKGPIVASEANYDQVFIQVAGDAAEGAYVTFLGAPPELLATTKDFMDRYKVRYPNDELKSYDHYGYTVTSLLLSGIAAVGPDRDKVIDYLRNVKSQGILGEISFDEKGDNKNQTVTLFAVKKGVFVPVKQGS